MQNKNKFVLSILIFTFSRTICMEDSPFHERLDDDFVAGVQHSLVLNSTLSFFLASSTHIARGVRNPAMLNPRNFLGAMGVCGGLVGLGMANWTVDGRPSLPPCVYKEPMFRRSIKDNPLALGMLSGDLLSWGMAGSLTLAAHRLPVARKTLVALHLLLASRVAYKLHYDGLSNGARKRTQQVDDTW